MKNQTTKKLFAFIIMMMFSFTFASAQSCPGNKIRVYKCISNSCHSKCVDPNNIPSGWSTSGCPAGCGVTFCNCNVRPIPYACGQICGFRISSSDNENPSNSLITSIVPNPVFGSTTISFSIEEAQNVSLKVFDMKGRLVITLADKIFEAGENELVWNSADVNAGVYFLKFQSAENLQTEKLIVTK